MKNALEAWVRENFSFAPPGNPQKPELTFDTARSIWHCLQGRFVKVEMREGTRTWDEDISLGAQVNSETLARLLAEKEGVKWIDQNEVVKGLIQNDPRFGLLKIPPDNRAWYVRSKERPTRENPFPIERNPESAKWGEKPQAIILTSNPWEPKISMYNPELPLPMILEYEKQSRTVIEAAWVVIDQQLRSGAVRYETNTFCGRDSSHPCAKPPGPAIQAVISVIQRTAKEWGENVKDLEEVFPRPAEKK